MRKLFLMTLVLVLIPSPAPADTIYVSPEDTLTIRTAIIWSSPGDEIVLRDGVFTGPGNRDLSLMGKNITVRSESNDPTLCIIDCEGTSTDFHRAFMLQEGEGTEALISGITITNGNHTWGGGIYNSYPSEVTITNCRFVNNQAYEGGGLAYTTFGRVSDCVFIGNTASTGGGMSTAMSLWDFPIIERCVFIGNTAFDWGGGFRA